MAYKDIGARRAYQREYYRKHSKRKHSKNNKHGKDRGRPTTVYAVNVFGKGKHNGLGMFESPCDNDDPLNYVYPE